MDTIRGFNEAIEYIEANLEQEIDLDKAAKIACCSNYHFIRMFSALVGCGVYEYVRKRKMTRAAEELQTTNIKIVDFALKYGYESPTSFNRVFKDIHGVSPSRARKERVVLASYLPISFKLKVIGVERMEYKIEEIKGFKAVGYKRSYNYKNGENFKKIPAFWQEVMEAGNLKVLRELNTDKELFILGVCANMRESDFDYYIATSTTDARPNDMEEINVATQTYAIFTCPLVEVQEVTKRIFAEWLPNSEYSHVPDAPELEIYLDEVTCKICIPIQK